MSPISTSGGTNTLLINTMNIKQITRTLAVHMDEDVLACHLKDAVDAVIPVLVFLYVAGMEAGEYIRTSLTWVSEQVSALPYVSDVSGTQLT